MLDETEKPSTLSTLPNNKPILKSSSQLLTQRKKSKKEELSTVSYSSNAKSLHTMDVLRLLRESSDVENRIRKNHRILERTSFFGGFSEMEFVWTFLTVLGVLGGMIGFCLDTLVDYIFIGRDSMIEGMVGASPSLKMFVWILYNLAFVIFSVLLTLWVSPIAEGSGIPSVKAILTGVDSLKEPLSFKNLLIKVIGVPCVVGSGLFSGKVGGMIAIGAALADNLLKLKPFRAMRKNKTLRVQLIGCGCALGVGAVFGTPAGGVLFALEAVGTYYSLRNYLKNFYVALIAAYVSRLLHSWHEYSILLVPVYNVNLDVPSFTVMDFLSLGFLGIVMGLLGVLFTFLNEKLLWLRNKIGRRYFLFFRRKHFNMEDQRASSDSSNIRLPLFKLNFYVIGKFMSLSPGTLIEDLMLNKPLLKENGAQGEWIPAALSDKISEASMDTMPFEYYAEVFKNLALFILVRVILTPLSVSLPLPTCIYVTLLIMGAGIGRFWGELLAFALPDGWSAIADTEKAYSYIRPGAYALVGGLALSASATQAFSTVFMFLEIAGMGVHWPACLASLVAVKISRALYYSAYDAQIKLRGWPALLETKTDSEDMKVRDIMTNVEKMIILEEKTTFNELEEIFESKDTIPKTFPVVNTKKDLVLLGVVSVIQLRTLYDTKKEELASIILQLEAQRQKELQKANHQNNNSTAVVTEQQVPSSSTTIDFDNLPELSLDEIKQGIGKPVTTSNYFYDIFDEFIGFKDYVGQAENIEQAHEEEEGNEIFQKIEQMTGIDALNKTPLMDEQGNTVSSSQSVDSIELEESAPEMEAVQEKKKQPIRLDYDTCQISIAEDTPAIIAHLLFSQLRLDDVFVLWNGRVIGQLHREVLIKGISEKKNLFSKISEMKKTK
ncbi:hypothetical protein C9374_002567 [Naegleria lovaniensis]|uniref:Chloride channel protein n=1 Tax=Naegleria lovaniensis TaxID=51637 RepID=A0AA88GUN2_NAELO|nr:uncharacterized protein C9374_002567 [Naegleria lovaniensis]KAG2386121.1 hypothetical protein C9374_002567 [Naegleria lovaniensis]